MRTSVKDISIPPQGMKTKNGYVYPVPQISKQISFLVSCFILAILLGFIITGIGGDLSKIAIGIIYFAFLLIFFIGYSIWVGLTKLMFLNAFKKNIISGIKSIVRKDEKSLKETFTINEDKLLDLIVSSQKYTIVFAILGWLFGTVAGILSLYFETSINKLFFFTLILIFSAGYGHLLYYFGRKGFFPFPEE